jgi:major outer membrane protein
MKKLTTAIFALLSTGTLCSLPVANPIDASIYKTGIFWTNSCCDSFASCFDAFSIRLGFWGDYVFNRHLEEDGVSESVVDQFFIEKNQGVVTLNWCDWIDVFGLVGVANFSQETPFDVSSQKIMYAIDYQAALSYGGGARLTLWECECFGLGIEGQYFRSQPKLENFTDFDSGFVGYPSDANASTYSEWQVGLGAAYTISTGYGNAFTPYAAVKFAGAKLDQNNDAYISGDSLLRQDNLKNQRTIGYAVGLTATVCQKGGLTVEGRFADEKAVFVNGQVRF